MSETKAESAVFSNLAKAAEKQQLYEAAGLFGKLAEYHRRDEVPAAALDALLEMIVGDIETEYPMLRETSAAVGDRGALRAITWGEKVTKAQRGLVNRYLSKGEDLLEDQKLHVCEACGFIFLGDTPPEICPVCKAPSRRFTWIK